MFVSGQMLSKVFCNSTENVFMAHRWMKRRLEHAGHGEISANFLTGNSTAEQKERTMNNFRSGYKNLLGTEWNRFDLQFMILRSGGILFCTDVALMGLNTPGLVVGVTLGEPCLKVVT